MAKKTKRQRKRRRQQKRAARAAKAKKRQRRRQSPSPRFSDVPGDLPDQETLTRGLLEMESLADEPEFADFELGEHTAELIAEVITSTDKDIKRLEEENDEEGIDELIAEASSEALRKAVTPAVKSDIHRRLEKLRHRLRREGQKQRAEGIAGLTSTLDFPPFPWTMFEPVRRAFDDAMKQTLSSLMLTLAVAEAAGRPAQDIELDDLGQLLQDPEVMARFEAQYETDETLQEVVDRQLEELEEAFSKSLYTGQLDLALFTQEELIVGVAWYEYELDQIEGDWSGKDEESDELARHQARLMVTAAADALSYLNTSVRRQQWHDRLTQVRTEKAWPPDIEVGLGLLRDDLSEPPHPEGPEQLLLSAFIGELYKAGGQWFSDSDPASKQQAQILEIKKRLERGEPPLA